MKADELVALAERVQALTGRDVLASDAVKVALWESSGRHPGDPLTDLSSAAEMVDAKKWHWRKLTGNSVSVYRQDPTKTATARFDGFGYDDACRMTSAYLLALADSVAIAEKAAARKVDA